jgi:hypothetical protein
MKTALERITALEFEVAKLRAIIKHYEREDSHDPTLRHETAITTASQSLRKGKGLLSYLLTMDQFGEHPHFKDCPDTYIECRANPDWMRKVRKEKHEVLKRYGLTTPRKGVR